MRYIDADWLLEAVEKLGIRITGEEIEAIALFTALNVLDNVEKIIKAAPTVEPIKHGHWIDYNYDVACSVCGTEFDKNDYCYEAFDYCPHCGAAMQEVQDGEV